MSRRRMAADIAALQRLAAQHRAEVDRLRAAADRLDEWCATFHGTTHLPGFVLANWRQEAKLLRAVAQAHDTDEDMCYHNRIDPVHAAADRTADVILGATNE